MEDAAVPRFGISRRSLTLRLVASIAAFATLAHAGVIGPSDKLTEDEKIELIRGLTAEFAKVKVPMARTKKPLEINSDGSFDQKKWADAFRSDGAAARTGDQIKITKIIFEGDKMEFEINGGITSGRHWYDHIQVGMGTPTDDQMSTMNASGTPTLGTYLVLNFHKPMEGLTSGDVKKMLAPILDFDPHTVTQLYSETLPPEIQKAIADKKAREGMTRDQVKLALGNPDNKYRETLKDGTETEDWIYGRPPGKITFVTFAGSKVIKVKDEYAGLGGEVN